MTRCTKQNINNRFDEFFDQNSMVNEEIILNEMICFTSCPVFIDFHLERCGVAMIADDKEMKGFLPVALVVTRQIFLWNEEAKSNR